MEKKTRRNFMKTLGASVGAAGVLGAGKLVSSCNRIEEVSGDQITLLTSSGELVVVDRTQLKPAEIPSLSENQKRGREGLPGRSWVMVIDLSKCRNARECMKACQAHHQLWPHQHHINVLQMQDSEDTAPYFMPKPCLHCDNPPCVRACPTKATFKNKDGLVMMDFHRCIGCRFCMAACPYGARSFNWRDPRGKEHGVPFIKKINPDFPTRMRGVVEKCSFCALRLAEGKKPLCVEATGNTGAMYFGDLNDPNSDASKVLQNKFTIQRKPALGTKPSVFYII